MSIPKIHEAILSIPASIIKDGSFQIKVIKQIDETLMSKLDVFSHRRSFYIDKHNRKKRKFTIKNAADKIFDVLPVLRKPLTFLYKRKYTMNHWITCLTIKYVKTFFQSTNLAVS